MPIDHHYYARLAQNHNARREIQKSLGYFPEDIKTEFDFRMEEKEQQERIRKIRKQKDYQREIELFLESSPLIAQQNRQESTCRPLKITLEDGRIILATEYKVLRKK